MGDLLSHINYTSDHISLSNSMNDHISLSKYCKQLGLCAKLSKAYEGL